MSSGWSALVGILLGLSYTCAGLLVVKVSQNTSKFVPIVIGGMVLRMFVALVVLFVITQLFSVGLLVLTGAFLLVVLIGIFGEITWLIYHN